MRKQKVKSFGARPAPQPLIKPDQAQEIDYEICWCIEKIEYMLSKEMSDKNRKQCELSLKILRNPEAALIKKRQVMRQQFGDYKKAMANDKLNIRNNINIKFRDVSFPLNSVFLRSKNAASNEISKMSAACSSDSSGSIDLNDSNAQDQKKMFGINLSDNSFRFNF